jgi:hypothetical protein
MSIDNEFFHSHDEDGFWTEVRILLAVPDEEKLNCAAAFLARFPQQQSSGTIEQFCRYAVRRVFEERVAEARCGFDHWLRTGFAQEAAARGVDVTVKGNTVTMRDKPRGRRR